ncbi:hypothetical protein DOTSEDRAFT_38514 [Dothistroma septosporum NZE10]|uniref:Uncharacterized protein n=1 Tax=Dothistroma septosporum (strain NZE10 / CBS 128990) TaxID=675120 RepID=M2WK20_DOTSN|nr:hypothetical protein DOTSEDRAFT_38514 [Dothistroma septosporum NZE10]
MSTSSRQTCVQHAATFRYLPLPQALHSLSASQLNHQFNSQEVPPAVHHCLISDLRVCPLLHRLLFSTSWNLPQRATALSVPMSNPRHSHSVTVSVHTTGSILGWFQDRQRPAERSHFVNADMNLPQNQQRSQYWALPIAVTAAIGPIPQNALYTVVGPMNTRQPEPDPGYQHKRGPMPMTDALRKFTSSMPDTADAPIQISDEQDEGGLERGGYGGRDKVRVRYRSPLLVGQRLYFKITASDYKRSANKAVCMNPDITP